MLKERKQSDSSDPFAKPRTFTPLHLLPRSQLPLAYLDTAHDGSRIFTAHIGVLEDGEEGCVLIVEEEKDGRLFAVERVVRRKYALCRLMETVKKEDLVGRRGGEEVVERQWKRRAVDGVEERPWWLGAGVEVDLEKSREGGGDGVRLSMFRKKDPAAIPGPVDSNAALPTDAAESQNLDTSTAAPTTQDTLEELAKAYLDALYLSRTPIAYFVKGPLARARAAFASQPADLVAFLRTSILSTTVVDKKYRDNIPEFIKELPILDTPDERSERKKKRKWKPNRDKSGFFVSEKDCLEQWWRGGDDIGATLGSAEKLDTAIRRRTQRIRSRETFLQVVLIFETLALEATLAKSTDASTTAPESQNVDSQAEESQAAAGGKKSRKKKVLDISELLDTLLDRLSMWFLIESSPVKTTGKDEGDEESSDELKSFACEVIIPFFSARIHEQAYAASKKLGGPKAPPKPESKASAPRKPGEPATRQPPAKEARKPVGRVSSDTLNKVGKRPTSLHRAATDSDTLSTMIKREMSETPPMDSIPLSKSRSQQKPGVKKRPSMLESLARREVDLTAMSQANEAKLKKKAEIEEKMRDAISTLKKPNRSRAVEETAKNADESFARAIAKGKSTGQRKTSDKNLVAATPRHVRATSAPKRHVYQGPDYSLSSSSVSVVTATSARQRAQPGEIPNSTLAVPQTSHRPQYGGSLVEDTPSRGFAKFMPPALSRTPGTLLESPTASRKSQIQSTPAKVSKMPSLMETPLAKVPGSILKGRTYSPMKNLAASPTKADAREDSGLCLNRNAALYDALGWNDDDEYEELP